MPLASKIAQKLIEAIPAEVLSAEAVAAAPWALAVVEREVFADKDDPFSPRAFEGGELAIVTQFAGKLVAYSPRLGNLVRVPSKRLRPVNAQ